MKAKRAATKLQKEEPPAVENSQPEPERPKLAPEIVDSQHAFEVIAACMQDVLSGVDYGVFMREMEDIKFRRSICHSIKEHAIYLNEKKPRPIKPERFVKQVEPAMTAFDRQKRNTITLKTRQFAKPETLIESPSFKKVKRISVLKGLHLMKSSRSQGANLSPRSTRSMRSSIALQRGDSPDLFFKLKAKR